MYKFTGLLTLTFSVLFAQASYANNGQTALVYPLGNDSITIDGRSGDWPKTLTEIPISRAFSGGDMPAKDDFSAYFKATYSVKENSVYVLLVVNDESHVIDESGSDDWSNQDSVILYLDAAHSQQGSGSILYQLIGDNQSTNSSPAHWDPNVRNASWDNATAKMQRLGTLTTYEWRFKLTQDLTNSRSLGFDFLISDKDEDDPADGQGQWFMWGPFTGKSQSPDRIGDLLLVKSDKDLGLMQGRVEWHASTTAQTKLERVKITSLDNNDFWLQTKVNEDGMYQVELPAGHYGVSNAYSIMGDPWRGLELVDNSSTVKVKVEAKGTVAAPNFLASLVEEPDLLEEKGVLLTFEQSKVSDLESAIKGYMDYYKVPGASVALIKDDQLVYHNVFGVKNQHTGEPVTGDTLFEAASITKAVFAFAVNRLAEKAIIDLDKPLYQYLPFEVIEHDVRYKKITARMVLSHQTGFPNWAWMNESGKLDIKFYPGIKFGYSGEGFEYLGRVVAHITGKSIEQVIQEQVQAPLEYNHNLYFSDSEELRTRVSHGHFAPYTTPINIPSRIGVAHSMHTEAKAFSQFMLGLMKQEGLTEQGYFNLLEPQVAIPVNTDEGDMPWPQRYGLGFHLNNTPLGLAYGHGGNNGDFTCIFFIYKELGVAFAIFTNSDSGTAFHKKMHEYLIYGKDYAAIDYQE